MTVEEKNPSAPSVVENSAEYLEILNKKTFLANGKESATPGHKFWSTQPLSTAAIDEIGPVEIKKLDDILKEPLPLPDLFVWDCLDLNGNEKNLFELFELLRDHYVEDDDSHFRFNYSLDFLKWSLCVPGFRPNWHLCVRVKDSQKIVAFIGAIPDEMVIRGKNLKVAVIDFLCIHKKLRHKRLAPLLIKEITRRVNLEEIWQAVYTTGVDLPQNFSTVRYFHRSLNFEKLLDIKFTCLKGKMTVSMANKFFKLPDKVELPGWRPFQEKDAESVSENLNEFLAKFFICPFFTPQKCLYNFLTRENVVFGFVNEENGRVKDFVSFYKVDSLVLKNKKHTTLSSAYCFYYFAKSLSLVELFRNALIEAKAANLDVFNALEIMENGKIFDELKFTKGDGILNYFLFNYKIGKVEGKDLAVILL